MAVLQMQRINICALRRERKHILEALQSRGVVEVSDLSPDDAMFDKVDVASQKVQFEKQVTSAAAALEVLDTYVPVKTSALAMFEGKTPITSAECNARKERRAEVLESVNRLNRLSKTISENKAEIVRRKAQLDALEPWLGLEVSLRFTGTSRTAAFVGSFMEELSLTEIHERIAAAAPAVDGVHVDIISTGREQTCVLIVTGKKNGQVLEDALRTCGFVRPASPPRQAPPERKKLLLSYIETAKKNVKDATEEICSMANVRDDLKFFMDDYSTRAEKYGAIGLLSHTKHTFLLTGFVPAKYGEGLARELTEKFGAAVSLTAPAQDEEVPVLLSNNKFVEPVESVVESYSLPTPSDIDPSAIMAPFYYLLFGLMLSDTAYGLMIVIGAALVLLKFKNMDYGLRKTMRMFLYCGISTTVWGILFGSYFGDIFDQVAKTYFGVPPEALPIVPPAWFVPLNEPMRMLVFCMLLGIIHLFVGLGIKGYLCIRSKAWYSLFADVIFWYMLVGGGIVYLLSMDMIKSILQISLVVPPAAGTVFGIVAIVGAVGIVLTNADSKNPGVRFAQGLYSLYNVTGYLSDILSYSRLLALGLATGVIGSVINQMGSMTGPIGFVIVFIVGHAINFGIEALGAYVHTNRLQYVEFFGKFYEGGARAFAPFAAHTKYFKF